MNSSRPGPVVFAAVAVCLAAAGVYGVVGQAVQQRSREIGLRMALGASRADVLRLMLGQGMMLAAVGAGVGPVAAAGATQLLESMLFAVTPLDVETYLAVAVLLGVATLLASYLPARRASGLDPMQVLKTD